MFQSLVHIVSRLFKMCDERKLLDVLEPYKEEILFNWIIRMAYRYGIYFLPETKRKEFKKELFGEKASPYPKGYFEFYLTTLVEKLKLPNSKYFGSAYDVLYKMTVYSF